jgi:DNA helicase II / ATP-dependent DNA helicase PcrA
MPRPQVPLKNAKARSWCVKHHLLGLARIWIPRAVPHRADPRSTRAGAVLKDEDYTVLSTIHSAKGQEWRIVRILNVVDGCIPSDRATGTSEEIEEERRLLYVAMTRAKDALDLIVPQRFFTHQQAKLGDRHVYASRSRFIPDSILGSFATRNWQDQTDGPIKVARQVGSSVDVAASLMRMWR